VHDALGEFDTARRGIALADDRDLRHREHVAMAAHRN
jgi:hypothetical protein